MYATSQYTRGGAFKYVYPKVFYTINPTLIGKGIVSSFNNQGLSGYTITSGATITTDCNQTNFYDLTGYTDSTNWTQYYNLIPSISFCTPTATPTQTPTVSLTRTPTGTPRVTPTRTPTANKVYRAFCSVPGTCTSGAIAYYTPGGLLGSRAYTSAEIDAGFLLPCAQNYPNPPVKSSGLGTVSFTIFSTC
jgi:hypothetical protein